MYCGGEGPPLKCSIGGSDTVVIDANNRRINWGKGIGRGKGLSMISTYTWVENSLGLHLRYLWIICDFPMSPGMGSKSQNVRIRSNYQWGEDHCQYLSRCLWFVWSFLNVKRL